MAGLSEAWGRLATQLRADSIRATTAAGSGHPTSSMSAADLMAVLLSGHFHYDWKNPRDLDNDRFILSKGHAAPPLRGCGHGFTGSGPPRGHRNGTGRAPYPAGYPLLGPPRRQRDVRGERVRGARVGRPLRTQPDHRPHRHEPAGTARPHHGAVGRRSIFGPRASIRME